MKRICTICARSGSQRFENKNIHPVQGAPLIAYSIVAAKRSEFFDKIVVTSDSNEYLEIGRRWGADKLVLRPPELAHSKIGKVFSIAHAVSQVEADWGFKFDTIADLDVTSPLRRLQDIRSAIELLEAGDCEAVVSATESKCTPYSNMFFKDSDGFIEPIIERSLLNEHTGSSRSCYALNASIYVWNRDWFITNPATFSKKTKLYIMPAFSRYDIDSAEDLAYVDFFMANDPQDIVRISDIA